MKVDMQPYKGARDFYPEDKRFQNWMFDKWRVVVESFGYEEYDAPLLERTELYLMKGSTEIVEDQTYTFKDRGDRSVTVRTEMTPSVSRMVAAKRQEIAYPARWYSIPDLWRYERMQRGRLREFWQLNVDIFGVESEMAEVEMIQISDGIMQEFGAQRSSYTVKINSRVLVELILKNQSVSGEESANVIRLIDRINKISKEAFEKQLEEITNAETARKIVEIVKINDVKDLPDELKDSESAQKLERITEKCKSLGISNIEFDLSLMRGFDYYTDIVFEVFDNDPKNNRSMFGGGRYDGLVGDFGVEPVPTVGFGMGDVTFEDFLRSNELLPDLAPSTDVVVIAKDFKSGQNAEVCAGKLRDLGLNVALDNSTRKFDKKYKMAIKSGVKYAVYVNKDSDDKYILKDLLSGKEDPYTLDGIASVISG